MKYSHFIISMMFMIDAVIYFAGCPMKVGECTYGKNPDLRGTVTIKSIEKVYNGKSAEYRVKVDGFFKREFFYTKEELMNNLTSRGYKAGSVIEGVISPGGPCPPIYYITGKQ